MFKIDNPTFGTDFEMPLINSEGNPISVVYKIGGSKKRPRSIGKGCFVQEDNVNAEMNIPAVDNLKDWNKYINYCIDTVNDLLRKEEGDLRLYPASSFIYADEELDTEEACEFGCEPSYNAYNFGLPFQKPSCDDPNLRSAGFHVHIGFKMPKNLDLQEVCEFMKHMDYYLGMPSVIVDTDKRRRKLYGKPGDFRFRVLEKENIIILEYRSLGTGIIKNINNTNWIYGAMHTAIASFCNGWEVPYDKVYEIIINSDAKAAEELCKAENIEIPYRVEELVCEC